MGNFSKVVGKLLNLVSPHCFTEYLEFDIENWRYLNSTYETLGLCAFLVLHMHNFEKQFFRQAFFLLARPCNVVSVKVDKNLNKILEFFVEEPSATFCTVGHCQALDRLILSSISVLKRPYNRENFQIHSRIDGLLPLTRNAVLPQNLSKLKTVTRSNISSLIPRVLSLKWMFSSHTWL